MPADKDFIDSLKKYVETTGPLEDITDLQERELFERLKEAGVNNVEKTFSIIQEFFSLSNSSRVARLLFLTHLDNLARYLYLTGRVEDAYNLLHSVVLLMGKGWAQA